MGLAPSIGWLFAGRLIAGVMGASITTANAYIADVSEPEVRARNFGFVGVAFGLGFIFGPAIGGLLGGIDLRLPFFAAAGLALVNALYGIFVLPESLPPEKRDAFSWEKANPAGSLLVLRSYPLVAGLAVSFVFVIMAQRGLETVWVLYTGHKFGWEELANGLSLALVGLMAVLVQGGLVQPVIKRIGERRAVLGGLVTAVITCGSSPSSSATTTSWNSDRAEPVESRAGAPAVGSGGYSVAFAPGRRPAPVVTFPAPAHRTGRADLPHPALSRDHAFAHGRCRVVSARRVRPHSSHSRRLENRTYFPDFTLCFRQNHCRSRRAAYASTAA